MDFGLTQQTLADRLVCWNQTVASWERDESVPLARRWPAIEAVLGAGLVPERDGLPDRVRTARLRLGLTQLELARRASMSGLSATWSADTSGRAGCEGLLRSK